MNNITDNQTLEESGDFSQDQLIDSNLFKKLKKTDYSIIEHSGFNRKLWEKFELKIQKTYYVSLAQSNRKALNIEITSNKIEISLLEKRELLKRIEKIDEKETCKIGWIYTGANKCNL